MLFLSNTILVGWYWGYKERDATLGIAVASFLLLLGKEVKTPRVSIIPKGNALERAMMECNNKKI